MKLIETQVAQPVVDWFTDQDGHAIPPRTVDRFWGRVSMGGPGCWLWTGPPDKTTGYARFSVNGKRDMAHRVAYRMVKGEIPVGLHIDHLCRNRLCMNPDHLEAVTCRENILRGVGATAQHARQTHCIRGHLLAGENLYVNSRGSRGCCSCRRQRGRAKWAAGYRPTAPRHNVVRIDDWSCRCTKCGLVWEKEPSARRRPFLTEEVNPRYLKGGRNKCYGRHRVEGGGR